MPNEPDRCIGVHIGDVVIQVLEESQPVSISTTIQRGYSLYQQSHTRSQTLASPPSMSARTSILLHNNHTRVSKRNQLWHSSTKIGGCPISQYVISSANHKWDYDGELTLNLSFLAVGPPVPSTPAEVPLIEITTVELVGSANYYLKISSRMPVERRVDSQHDLAIHRRSPPSQRAQWRCILLQATTRHCLARHMRYSSSLPV